MTKQIIRTLTEDEVKEAVALWCNCSCSKSDETVSKDDVAFKYFPDNDEFMAQVQKEVK